MSTLFANVKLGPYEVVGPLGAGGMGEVFRARDELVFTAAGSQVSAVSIAPSATGLAIGDPRRLFEFPPDVIDLACARDHSRFLAVVQPLSKEKPAMMLLLGWHGGRRP